MNIFSILINKDDKAVGQLKKIHQVTPEENLEYLVMLGLWSLFSSELKWQNMLEANLL